MTHIKKDGTPCGWGDEHCTIHPPAERTSARPATSAGAGEAEVHLEFPRGLAEAFAKREMRTVAWHFLEHLRRDEQFTKNASAAATIMRVIHALGEEPANRSAQLEEIAVIGGVLNGIPPRDEAHWAVAERLFEPGTIEELRKWTPSVGWFGHPGEPDPDDEETPEVS